MHVLFISEIGECLSLALKVEEEGHTYTFYINDEKFRNVGNRIVKKVNLESGLYKNGEYNNVILSSLLFPRPDCIVFDGISSGGMIDHLRDSGYPVIGANDVCSHMQTNASYLINIFKTVGLNCSPDNWASPSTICVEGVFNGDKFISTFYSIIHRPLCNNDLGPVTDGMGCVIKTTSINAKIVRETLSRLEAVLKKIRHHGFISVCMSTAGNNLQIKGMRASFNFITLYAYLELIKGGIGDFLLGVADGSTKRIEMRSNVATCVVIHSHEFNNPLILDMMDEEIKGIEEDNHKHSWFFDICGKGKKLVCANTCGKVCTISARGDRVGDFSPYRDAKRRVYRTVSFLSIPNAIYRTDIGEGTQALEGLLKGKGWID